MASFTLRGVDNTVAQMRTLAPKLQRSGLRKAARRAMNIVRDAARARAKELDDPETPAKIWKNIVTQESTQRSKQEGGVVMRVGIRGGAAANQHSTDASGNPGGDTRHWRYIEFGTEHNPAVPFMRPAFSSNIGAVTEKFVQELNSEISAALGGG